MILMVITDFNGKKWNIPPEKEARPIMSRVAYRTDLSTSVIIVCLDEHVLVSQFNVFRY